MFVPSSSSRLQSLAGWILGRFHLNLSKNGGIQIWRQNKRQLLTWKSQLKVSFICKGRHATRKAKNIKTFRRPELVDPRSVARGEGRQVLQHLSRFLTSSFWPWQLWTYPWDKTKRQKDKKESFILWCHGNFALLQCFQDEFFFCTF